MCVWLVCVVCLSVYISHHTHTDTHSLTLTHRTLSRGVRNHMTSHDSMDSRQQVPIPDCLFFLTLCTVSTRQNQRAAMTDRAFPWFGALSKEGKASVVNVASSLDCHKSEGLVLHPRSARGHISVDTYSNTKLSSFCPPPAPTPTVDPRRDGCSIRSSHPCATYTPLHVSECLYLV